MTEKMVFYAVVMDQHDHDDFPILMETELSKDGTLEQAQRRKKKIEKSYNRDCSIVKLSPASSSDELLMLNMIECALSKKIKQARNLINGDN